MSSYGGLVPILPTILGRAQFTVGASAAIFGLLGALVYAGRRGIAMEMGRQAWIYAIILFVFGIVMPQVDNWAHLGGFLGGFGLAHWMNPMRPERPDHLFAALGALALTFLAILLSVLSGLTIQAG
jgi:rhomboid protease GluP